MLLLFVLISFAWCHNCIHDNLHEMGLLSEIVKKPDSSSLNLYRTNLEAPAFSNIRFHLDWSAFPLDDPILTSWIQNDILPETLAFLTKTFSVNNIRSNLVLHKRCREAYTNPYRCVTYWEPTTCGSNITIPANYLEEAGGPGVPDSDFILFVSAFPTTGNTLAYALTCQTLGTNPQLEISPGRPIAGQINFGSQLILQSKRTPEEKEKWIKIAIHEIMHALGFSKNLFKTFIDKNGNQLPVESILRNTRERGYNQTKLVTPKVLEIAKQHFDCPSLNGVELESQGGSGTAGSHFSTRVYMDDIMIGVSLSPRYSEVTALTLALFEDSGWYQVDYSMAKPIKWGKNQGCDFPLKKCIEDQQPLFPVWCTTPQKSKCTSYRDGKGVCAIANYSASLPIEFRYFPSPNIGGAIQTADFCPTVVGITFNFGDFKMTSSCQDPSNILPPNLWLESYGPTGKCFSSSLLDKPSGSYFSPIGIGCHIVSQCNQADQSYSVTIGNTPTKCVPGQHLTFPGVSGNLTCAAYAEVCE